MALADHKKESQNVVMNVKGEQWSTWRHMEEKKIGHPLFCVQVRHVNEVMGSDPARGASVHRKKNPKVFAPVLLHSCGKAAEVIIL